MLLEPGTVAAALPLRRPQLGRPLLGEDDLLWELSETQKLAVAG